MSSVEPKTNESIDNLMRGVGHIDNLAWWPAFFIKVLSAILVVIFTWLQFKNYEIAQLIEKTEPQTFLRFIMLMFFLSWVAGPSFDIRIQKAAYLRDPDRGAITPTGISLLLLFSLSAVLMLWATQSEKTFFVALTGFIVLNIIGYTFIYIRTRSIAQSSEMELRESKTSFHLAKLHFVKEFMFGRWQTYRFLFMTFSITVLDALCFVTPLRSAASGLLHQYIPISQNTLSSLLPDLGLMCFLLASEGWIWTQRLKVSVALETIDILSRDYELCLLSNK